MSHRLQTSPGASRGVLALRLVVVAALTFLEALLVLTLVLALRQPSPGGTMAWVVQAVVTLVLLAALPRLWRWALDARPRASGPVLPDAEDVGPSPHSSFAGPDAPAPPRRW
ncbi:hypothetical protein [Cellulomonas xylanilytica]|uniref:Uncharacterized protein n=1 Tax=Cellulomonas xylanilytica TaxID=233583 RepID=A0A510UZ58_9CELL|nr:hypothetical protein [Cellulomonas xylanilytica]GEK19954.1 hypothetical protein CXY01_04740 [Cellulomonas xylanilytica]